RLTPTSPILNTKYEIENINSGRIERVNKKIEETAKLIEFFKSYSVQPAEVNILLEQSGTPPMPRSQRLFNLLLRPQVNLKNLINAITALKEAVNAIPSGITESVIEQAEIATTYDGYLEK